MTKHNKKYIVRAVVSKVIHIEEDVPIKLVLTEEEKKEFGSLTPQDQAAWLRERGTLPFEDIAEEEDVILELEDGGIYGDVDIDTVIGEVELETIEIGRWDGVEGTLEEFNNLVGSYELFDLDSYEVYDHGEGLSLEEVFSYLDDNKEPDSESITLQNTEFTEDDLSLYLDNITKNKGGHS